MKNIFKIQLIILMVGMALTGCYKDRIDIDLNDENKKVVVEAWITDLDEPQWVKLSYTTNYLDSGAKDIIQNAEISLKNSTGVSQFSEEEPGTYYLENGWNPVIGEEYTLEVKVGQELYSATAKMRLCPEIDNLHTIDEEFDDDVWMKGTSFDFQETEGLGDGYFGRDYKLGSLRKDSLSNGSFIDDEFYDGIYFEEIELSQIGYEVGDTVVLDLFSIGVEASKFLQDIQDEIFRGGLFDPPPVNIRSNFSNGAVGYFIIGGAQREMIIIE